MSFLSQDRILRATSDSAKFRLVLVDATRAAGTIAAQHEARGYAAQLLGEAIASALLTASGLKGPGTVQLRFTLSGDISRVNADATPFGLVRAMIPREEILRTGTFEPMLSPQTLRVIKLDRDGSRLSEGVVEMVSTDISRSMTHYLKQSEQGTALLRVEAKSAPNAEESGPKLRYAAGVLIETFPGATPADWQAAEATANALDFSAHVREGGQGIDLDSVKDAFAAFGIQVHREFEIEPFCPCSEESVKRALSGLGREGLESLFLEGQEAELHCEFCRKRYVVSNAEILGLLNEAEEAELQAAAEGRDSGEPEAIDGEIGGDGGEPGEYDKS